MKLASSSLLGVLFVVLAAMLWGTTGTAQALSTGAVSPQWIGALRLLSSAVFFALALLVVSGRASNQVMPRRAADWAPLLLAGIAMAVYNLSFFAGVHALGVGVGTAITIGSAPLWAGIMQWVLLRQAPTQAWWLGTALAVVGAGWLLAGGQDKAPFTLPGLTLCLLAGASYAAFALANKRLVSGTSPLKATASVFAIAAMIAVPIAAWQAGALILGGRDLLVVAHLGVIATGVAYWLFAAGQRFISGPSAVTLALAEPLTAFVLAAVFLGEAATMSSAAAMILLIAGLFVVVRGERRT